MSDCARRMQPAEREKSAVREQRTRSILFSESCTPAGCWARQQCARQRDLYKKASHPAGSTARSLCVCCWECWMRVCFVLAGAHTTHMDASESGAYLHLKAAATGLRRALSLSEVIVSGAHCTCAGSLVFVCCHRAYLVQGENIRVRSDNTATPRLAPKQNTSL